TADTLTDGNTDSIYTKTFTLLENANVNYKFYKTVRGGSDWEGDPNRVFTVPVGGGNPDTVYFDRDEVVDALVSGQVLWRVDMTTFENLGWFRRLSGDSVEVRGNFNGWSGTKLERVPSTEVYELLLPFDLSPANSDFSYKFFMDLDTNGIAARFPGYVDDPDGFRYDHPTERGDGNRQFNIGSGGNLEPPIVYFSSINPGGVILAGDTVTATFQVDMRPAMAYINPFVPSTDTAFIVWNDDPSRSKQGNPPNVRLSDANSDSIYTGNLTIAGPAHYNLLYFVRFEQPGGTSEEEGAGLGAQFGYRSRYITPTSPNTFTRNFTLPIDVWKADPPYPAETPPLVTAIEKAPLGPPDQFTLAQNYPNPFNPSTNIRYNLPSQARVILKIFNLLGQEVATLVNGTQVAGEHMVVFEAGRLAAGIYFYSLHAGEFREVRKMLLLK
ncbi:MAG: T9SS type A sorting domain-containing protein, partial [Bacteroidota bacterium]